MAKLDFSLKIVSPAFVAGVMEIGEFGDGLRIPSLRGVLRFWFRAMNHHSISEELFKAEAEVFGSTERGQGIRFIPTGIENWKSGRVDGDYAMGYLGFGPMMNVRGGSSSYHRNGSRDAILPGTVFKFRAIGDKYQIKALERSLMLLHLFGGIGSRSRRAFGSVKVISGFIPPLETNQQVIDWFSNVLDSVWPASQKPSMLSHLPIYSSFSSNSIIKISKKPKNNINAVIQEFHNRFKAIRIYKKGNHAGSPQIARDDHDLELKDSTNSNRDITGVPQRLAFGMPYHPQSRDNGWDIEYFGYYPDPKNPGKIRKKDRRASPLILKVFHGPDGNYYAVSLFLKAQFFGIPGVEIGQSEGGKKMAFSNWHAIDEFLRCPDWRTVPIP